MKRLSCVLMQISGTILVFPGSFLLIGVLVMAAERALADDTYGYLGAISKHVSGGEYNEDHELIGVEHSGVLALYFPNSFDEDTFTLGPHINLWNEADMGLPLKVGLYPALVYGYRDCMGPSEGSVEDRRLCFWPIPTLTYTKYDHQILGIPLGTSGIALTYRYRF